MKTVKISGVSQTITHLKKHQHKIGFSLERGLWHAGGFLLRESQKIVPVQTGNLKASGFRRLIGWGMKADCVVGYTANYATFVHENLKAAHGREFNIKHAIDIVHAQVKELKASTAQGGMFERGENQQAKFLERPAKEHRHLILKMIRDYAKKYI